MKFVAKERKTIDAIRWDGSNEHEIEEWAKALGLRVGANYPVPGDALVFHARTLWAMTLHGEVEIDRGSWAAYGGTDVYPLDDGELHRLYEADDDRDEPDPVSVATVKAGAPLLGLATTRQLLDEIEARMTTDLRRAEAGKVGTALINAAWHVQRVAASLDDEALDYRTVDS